MKNIIFIENSSIFSIENQLTFIENSSTFVNNSSISIKDSTITKKISRDEMTFNSSNFDFFDIQRLEFNQIIVATLRTNVSKSFFDLFNSLNSSNNENNIDNNEKYKSNNIEYFDFEFEKSINIDNLIVNFNRYIFYRDIYVFVNRLKNLILLHNKNKLRIVISQYSHNIILI